MRRLESDLEQLNQQLLEMGALVASSVHRSTQSLIDKNQVLAHQVLRDEARIAAARAVLRKALGWPGLVDAAAIVGAFHGFVRIADAIGIPYTTAARGGDVPELRERAGVNEFYRVRGEMA